MLKLTRHAILLVVGFSTCVSAAQAQSAFFDPVIDNSTAMNSQADTGAFGFTTDTTGGTLGPSGNTGNQMVGVPSAEQGLMAIGAGFNKPACGLFGSGGFSGGGGRSSGANYFGLPPTATSLVDITVAE